MKIAFSSLVCPGWDLATILAKAEEYGFDGVELRGVAGELRLTQVPELCANPGAVRQMFAGKKLELICLGTGCTLEAKDRGRAAEQRAELEPTIELASKLGCPFVRLFVGDIPKRDTREDTLWRVAQSLIQVAPFAADLHVTVLLENTGDFCGSDALWYLCDAVSHPAVRVCWNPLNAMLIGERPTISIPRLGNKIGMVHACDGRLNDGGGMDGYALPGEGDIGWDRCIEILRGVFYDDYLVFEWPKLWDPSLPNADDVLPKVKSYLRERLDDKQVILSAYKGDKKAPRFRTPPDRAAARPS